MFRVKYHQEQSMHNVAKHDIVALFGIVLVIVPLAIFARSSLDDINDAGTEYVPESGTQNNGKINGIYVAIRAGTDVSRFLGGESRFLCNDYNGSLAGLSNAPVYLTNSEKCAEFENHHSQPKNDDFKPSISANRAVQLLMNPADTIVDIDGNTYHTIKIGNQIWAVENMKTTKYNDGTAIPLVTENSDWTRTGTPAYCWYGNDKSNKKKYGALYNWYVVNTGKIAPKGWHVPTDKEWTTLEEYLIANGYNWRGITADNKIGKSIAAKTDWVKSSNPGTIGCYLSTNNSTCFSAFPGGIRNDYGSFDLVSNYGYWWSASECDTSDAYNRGLYYNGDFLGRYEFRKSCGFSVRLVKD
jgi:uncharacterized protein (TIGR02145 family)